MVSILCENFLKKEREKVMRSLSSKNVNSRVQSAGNPENWFPTLRMDRVRISSLVETPETTRAGTFPKNFSQWLAGFIDGNGSLLMNKKGYPSLELTVSFEDLPLLRFLQDKTGGSIKIRAGGKSYRYRLHHKEGLVNLLNSVNGYIRQRARLKQLHLLCQQLELPILSPEALDRSSAWFTGFFDAEGSLSFSMKYRSPQLSFRVVEKVFHELEPFQQEFGGSIYFDNSRNGYYAWSVQKREEVLDLLTYFRFHPSRSHKSKRIFLLKEYYRLLDLEAFRESNAHYPAWEKFSKKWGSS